MVRYFLKHRKQDPFSIHGSQTSGFQGGSKEEIFGEHFSPLLGQLSCLKERSGLARVIFTILKAVLFFL